MLCESETDRYERQWISADLPCIGGTIRRGAVPLAEAVQFFRSARDLQCGAPSVLSGERIRRGFDETYRLYLSQCDCLEA